MFHTICTNDSNLYRMAIKMAEMRIQARRVATAVAASASPGGPQGYSYADRQGAGDCNRRPPPYWCSQPVTSMPGVPRPTPDPKGYFIPYWNRSGKDTEFPTEGPTEAPGKKKKSKKPKKKKNKKNKKKKTAAEESV